MKDIIFNGALERRTESTSGFITNYFADQLLNLKIKTEVFNLADSGIPLSDTSLRKTPLAVERMY